MMDHEFSVALSPQAKSLIMEFHEKTRHQYINDRMMGGLDHFANLYQKIKDESWPGCVSYEDFYDLPEHIRQECIDQHGFSPEIFQKSIEQDVDRVLQHLQQNVLRGQESVVRMLREHIDLLQHKRVIDFACYRGVYAFFAAENQCKHVMGIDVRADNVLVADTIRKTTKYLHNSNLDFQVGDLHHYDHNLRLCREADVIFLFGILYHVHDHYDILKSTCLSNVQSVMIETGIHHSEGPTVSWKLEPTFELIAGHLDALEKIPVGYPSISYLDMIMDSLGYRRTYLAQHDVYSSASLTDEFKMPRACLVYQR